MKVSVVIPVYNTEDYIEDTLRCIINQDIASLEIIVIDDGSTDSSYQVILSLADQDRRIKIYRQENKGQSAARNLGISVAKGEYIYFMDSDDLLDRDTLSACYEACKRDNLDLLFFDAEVFGEIKNMMNLNYRRSHLIKEGIYSGPEILNTLLKNGGYRASPCLSFIRLSYLKKIDLSFYPGIIHEDELFTLLLFIHAGRVSFINKPYFKRRLRNNSTMSAIFSRKNLNGYFTVTNELKKINHTLSNKRIKSLVRLRLNNIVSGMMYNSRSMKQKDRFYVLFRCLLNYPHYTSLKNIMALAFPRLQHLKRSA